MHSDRRRRGTARSPAYQGGPYKPCAASMDLGRCPSTVGVPKAVAMVTGMPRPVHPRCLPSRVGPALPVTVLSPDAPRARHLESFASRGSLAIVASGLVVGAAPLTVTIDDHAAARGWTAGTIAASVRETAIVRVCSPARTS